MLGLTKDGGDEGGIAEGLIQWHSGVLELLIRQLASKTKKFTHANWHKTKIETMFKTIVLSSA